MADLKSMSVGVLAGINGGLATVYVGQPLDTIKVKMQVFPELYRNAWECCRLTVMKDGVIRGLYAGTTPAVFANVAENAVLFCALPPSQELVRRLCKKQPNDDLTELQHALSGSLASFWSALIMCPTELVKCKVQSKREMFDLRLTTPKPSNSGTWGVIKTIFQTEGFSGFSRGLGVTLLRDVLGYFCFFGSYEFCRSMFAGRTGQKESIGPIRTAFCGGIAGAMLWIPIYPLDLVKSRLQIGHINSLSHPETGKLVTIRLSNLLSLITHIVRHEGKVMYTNTSNPPHVTHLSYLSLHLGFSSLYRGLGATLIRTFPATAALFIAVEWTRKGCYWLLD